MTFRALNHLRSCDLILAEDTRQTKKLLNHFEINNSVESYHQNNEHGKLSYVIHKLTQGLHITYCTDAGTPGISDPGFLLVREAIAQNIKVECLPGATAFVPALVASGLPCDRFVFEGFLPHKKGRQKRLTNLIDEERTMVFYESPHRILKTLNQFVEFFGSERGASISREISKMHESQYRGTLAEVIEQLAADTVKGEFVVCIAGKP
ncbi:MAG: 16S rRNA (cytidine(1402)-2'-O)-methyltransferase [Bacteroidia bacterium]|nr:16S rRNA (cytidine(1402)-2'-O)-methyltransferase [Bacteroidia bacterium]